MKLSSLGVAALAALAALGCSTSPKVTLAAVGTSPAGHFAPGLATVPLGTVLGFDVNAESSTPVTVAIDDPAVATVAPTMKGSQFVLVGLATGETTLRVFVNNQESAELPVQVTTSTD